MVERQLSNRQLAIWKLQILIKSESLDQIVMLTETVIDLTPPHLNVCQPNDSSNCADQGYFKCIYYKWFWPVNTEPIKGNTNDYKKQDLYCKTFFIQNLQKIDRFCNKRASYLSSLTLNCLDKHTNLKIALAYYGVCALWIGNVFKVQVPQSWNSLKFVW